MKLRLCYKLGRPQGTSVANCLAEVVRKKLHEGTLPSTPPLKVWPGVGQGRPCTACETPILPSQTQYEAQYYDGQAAVFLHVRCHQLWEGERHRLGGR
jgi:hypothetical protein